MKFVAVFVLAMTVLSSLAPAGAAQIRLNEILADPNSDWDADGTVDSKLDEWVEVVNIGASPVDLSTFRLSDASGGTTFRFALSGMLNPGEVRVYYGSAVVAWQVSNGVSSLGLSLNNAGDTVLLYDVSSGSPATVDELTYGGAEVTDDRALGRLPSGMGGWVVFDGLNAYSGTAFPASGCSPSPGGESACATPVEETSWGRMKAQYEKSL